VGAGARTCNAVEEILRQQSLLADREQPLAVAGGSRTGQNERRHGKQSDIELSDGWRSTPARCPEGGGAREGAERLDWRPAEAVEGSWL
jgi:hypothetical protein